MSWSDSRCSPWGRACRKWTDPAYLAELLSTARFASTGSSSNMTAALPTAAWPTVPRMERCRTRRAQRATCLPVRVVRVAAPAQVAAPATRAGFPAQAAAPTLPAEAPADPTRRAEDRADPVRAAMREAVAVAVDPLAAAAVAASATPQGIPRRWSQGCSWRYSSLAGAGLAVGEHRSAQMLGRS